MNFIKAKHRIATLWFGYGFILFMTLFVQTLKGKFEDKSQDVWAWFLSMIMPTLTLMISVFVFDISNANKEQTVLPFYFRLVMALSFFYLSALFIIIFVEPATDYNILQLTKTATIYMGPFQGLVTAAMGLFFIKRSN